MKQKLKQPARLFLATILLFSVVNCTKDSFEDIQNLQPNEELLTSKAPFQIDYLSANQAPVFVKEMLPSRNRDNSVTSTNNYTDAETGAVFDEQTIMKVTDTLGNTNYTIRFGFPRTPERIFYNLIVGRDSQGVMNVPYIVRYVSDSTAFDAFKSSNYDFSKFRGKITYHKYADFFGTDKSLIGDLIIANRANSRGQTTIDVQTSCPTVFDEFGDPIACETITLDGGTSGSTGGSSGSGDGLNPGDTAGTDSGVDSGSSSGDGSTSGGSDGTREPEDPIDPVGGDPCCDTGGGATLDGGRVVVTESYVITTDTWPSGNGSCSQTTVTSSKTYSDGTTEYSSRTTGIDCVSFNETGTIKTATNSFEECPECVPPAEGSIGILPPKGTTEEVVNEEEQVVNNLTGKADCVYQKLLSSSTGFANAIKKFDGEFPVAHLTLSIDNSLRLGNYGVTMIPSNFNITVAFSNVQLSNISDLGSAVAFAHEIIHAEIFRKMLSAAQTGDLEPETMTQQQQIDFVNRLRDDFPGIYDYYIGRYRPTWNHNMMAQHYRKTIADIIEIFDNRRLSREVYEDISWAGLRTIENMNQSIAWSSLNPLEQKRVLLNLDKYFFNGLSNCE